jgi:hypothetical protein
VNQRRQKHSLLKKKDIPDQADGNTETHVAIAARLRTAPSTFNTLLKTGKTLKSVKHNAAGSLVKGRV